MIRNLFIFCVAILLAESRGWAQDDADGPAAPSVTTKSYVIELTKFRVKDSSIDQRSTDDIVKVFNRAKDNEEIDDVEIVETIRLTAVSGHQSMVQVGRVVAVTVGAVHRPGQPPVRNMQSQSIGTVVTATIVPDQTPNDSGDGKVLLNLRYEASHHEGDGGDDSPPDTVSLQSEVKLAAELGKTVFVAGTSAERSSYLVVSVNEL